MEVWNDSQSRQPHSNYNFVPPEESEFSENIRKIPQGRMRQNGDQRRSLGTLGHLLLPRIPHSLIGECLHHFIDRTWLGLSIPGDNVLREEEKCGASGKRVIEVASWRWLTTSLSRDAQSCHKLGPYEINSLVQCAFCTPTLGSTASLSRSSVLVFTQVTTFQLSFSLCLSSLFALFVACFFCFLFLVVLFVVLTPAFHVRQTV